VEPRVSEKLKPNFTPVPNIILDEIMRTLNEGGFKTLMAIYRKTYGWGKQSDQISLTQLAELTGLDRSDVARARKRLGALVEVIPGSATTASTYRLNIEIADTDLARIASDPSATSDRGTTSVKGSDPSATYNRKQKKEDKSGAKAPDSPSLGEAQSSPNKRSRKLTRPACPPELQPAVFRIIARMNELAGTAYKPDSKIVLKGLVQRLKGGATEAQCIAVIEDRWCEWGADSKMRQHYTPETLFRESNFEKYLNAVRMAGAVNGNGHIAKPAKVRDLGNGMMEVDGRQMDRETYERRYGQAAI
jgi:phage replication O-like protein O